jgi:hypothetical protein
MRFDLVQKLADRFDIRVWFILHSEMCAILEDPQSCSGDQTAVLLRCGWCRFIVPAGGKEHGQIQCFQLLRAFVGS